MTIKELIEALSQFPQDMRVVIDDADTGWYLNIRHVEKSEKSEESEENKEHIITLRGSYGED